MAICGNKLIQLAKEEERKVLIAIDIPVVINSELIQLEAIVKEGLQHGTYRAALALAQIRDRGLYKWFASITVKCNPQRELGLGAIGID